MRGITCAEFTPMFTYRLYGIVLASSRYFPELSSTDRATPDITLSFIPGWVDGPPGVEWFHDWTPEGGDTWLVLGRQGAEYVLWYTEWMHFRLSADGREILCQSAPEIPDETVRHLFLDQILPLILAHSGRTVFHASAVARGNDAVAFLGPSGRGKTTLALGMCRDGFSLLADDGLVLDMDADAVQAQPSYPGIRYWPEAAKALFHAPMPRRRVAHYTKKERLGSRSGGDIPFHDHAAQLRRMYVLTPPRADQSDAVAITRLAPKEAFLELLPQAFRLDMMDRDQLQREFVHMNRLAELPLFRRLCYPRRLDLLPRVREAVLADLESSS
jgi:hypothetical protein